MFSKAIHLCLECIGIGFKEKTVKNFSLKEFFAKKIQFKYFPHS
ncbi:hypothetical protein HMPREF1987_00121 [Peptostreptococcaceae bacterium oral taxon 113 str. W5053]|nr:hypothetical protein HMPREF1987_00121 [Peptostreptococcaceae bacterium oral taxon 113 str. W5053]